MLTVLRTATEEDASAIAEVLVASRQVFLPYAPLAHAPPDICRWVKGTLIPSHQVTVACVSVVVVVGVVAAIEADGQAWIDQLYLRPGFTGQGIGSSLLVQALSSLPRPVRLHTFQANAGARRFYEQHGFKAVAFTDGSTNEEGCPDVVYELAAIHSRRGVLADEDLPKLGGVGAG